MGQPSHIDELGLGFIGYTMDEGRAILASSCLPDDLACEHRGDALRMQDCDLCGHKAQQMEVFSCELHGECSLHKKHSEVRGCAACSDRPAVRHELSLAATESTSHPASAG